jgi:hypothetical protein
VLAKRMQRMDEHSLEYYEKKFNELFIMLVRDLSERAPNDDVIGRVKKRAIFVGEFFPDIFVKEVGLYLYRYRAQIYIDDDNQLEEFFMGASFSEELNNGADDNVRLARHIIEEVKKNAQKANINEKRKYREIVTQLLDYYVDYMLIRATLVIGL